MNKNIELEIFDNKRSSWLPLAKVFVHEVKKSYYSRTTYEPEMKYYFEHQEHDESIGIYTPSVHLPLSLVNTDFNNWPSFLCDFLPQGAVRVNICRKHQIVDSQENDFEILLKSAMNPIGNVRVKPYEELFNSHHEGFEIKDILERNEEFIDYAIKVGALVSGGTGAQGVALKFLLNIDKKGKWHFDGAIPDSEVAKSYLVKFPRGRATQDRLILQIEVSYLKIAQELGLKSVEDVWFKEGMLFIERFDRKIDKSVSRFGVETLASVSGLPGFGQTQNHEKTLEFIHQFSSNSEDIFEFISRDFLNIVMGNTDNHLRNTSFIKYSDKEIELTPLYDFAPMAFDPEIIVRSCKWRDESVSIPNFESIYNELLKYSSQKRIDEFFTNWVEKLEKLPKLWDKYKIDSQVQEQGMKKFNHFQKEYGEFYERKISKK